MRNLLRVLVARIKLCIPEKICETKDKKGVDIFLYMMYYIQVGCESDEDMGS